MIEKSVKMKSKPKNILIILSFLFFPILHFAQQDIYKNIEDVEVYELKNVETNPETAKKLEKVAMQFFNSFLKEDFNGIVATSAFPFNWDRAAFIENEKQFEAYYNERNRQEKSQKEKNDEILKTVDVYEVQHKKMLVMGSVPIDVYYVLLKFKHNK